MEVGIQTEPGKTMIVQADKNLQVLVPNCVFQSELPVVQVMNDSDVSITLHAGLVIGSATEADCLLDDGDSSLVTILSESSLVETSNDTSHSVFQLTNTDTSSVPRHLQVLYDKSATNLTEEQKLVLRQVLIEYADVFAEHDLDIRCFESIELEIDMRDAKPIKQQMRRIPIQFENEEESCIQKMIDAGVIQESNSDCASPPVFI